MRRWICLAIAIAICVMLAACAAVEPTETHPAETAAPTDAKQIPPIHCDPAEAVDFSLLIEEISAERKDELTSDVDWSNLQKYVGEEKNLLTDAEIRLLTTQTNKTKVAVTYEEAVADMDLLFRTYAQAYGAYHFFGEEQFQNAHEKILTWLEGQETVVVSVLNQVYLDAMQFMRDNHAGLWTPGSKFYENLRYHCFFAEGWEFAKDDTGFYAMEGGTKWYVDSFSNSQVSIDYKLCADGRIVYAPVLFCTVPESNPCDISLYNTSGEQVTQSITWTQSVDYPRNPPDIQFWQENGIAYLSVRSFDSNRYGKEIQSKFVSTGKQLQNAKLIIFDLRGNSGGTSRFGTDWFHNFTGQWASPRLGGVSRGDALTRILYPNLPKNKEVTTFNGAFLENDIPIMVLVDNQVASAGETMMTELTTMDNVIVVGSNTSGCFLCGNVMQLRLPNSGMQFSLGADLTFTSDSLENVDFQGFTPDIWCDPSIAIHAVLEMLNIYDLADNATVNALKEAEASRPGVLTLKMWDDTVYNGGMLGSSDFGTHKVPVYLNGEPIEDFTVSGGTGWVEVTKENGQIQFNNLQVMTGRTCPITVSVGNATASFLWFAG